jgi:hypothetical protein
MKKLFLSSILIFSQLYPSAEEELRARRCQADFDAQVTGILRNLRATVSPQTVTLAESYISLVKQRELLDAHMLVLERTELSDPRIQGPLKWAYDEFANCVRLNLIHPQAGHLASCEINYTQEVTQALSKLSHELSTNFSFNSLQRCRILIAAEQYIQLYRQRGEVNGQLLLFEQQTILNVKPLEGLLRKPYDIYDQCKDPHSIVPLNFEPPASKCDTIKT